MMALIRQAAPLRVQAVNHIRSKIVSGDFPPRMRLIEKRLEEELGVSRTVVREALRQLESERLVTMEANVGPIVSALSYDDVVHLYQVRATLESAAGRLAAESGTSVQIERIQAALAAIRTEAERVEIPMLIELKNDFYTALIDASGNPIIGEMLSNVQARISQLRALTLHSEGRARHMVAELTRVVDAIEQGDPDRAEEACRAHVAVAEKIALRLAGALDEAESDLQNPIESMGTAS
ncbi:GntR family transcriptional regulator [Subtercola vilae]|uniref:GntR family transcriptional regulator n=1 Tax=Subtercola vilae TaxID=2056433 RepID=A0A4T2BDW7_9MICO|nr:GntR family transcriptional regulator [Subtercola vilae]TIH29573.1 GntR family transcriptional regulator [Subtercola vilae]